MFVKNPIRRSQLISPYGVGQIIPYPNDLTLMVAGLDAWQEIYNKASDINEFIIREERLEKRLGVKKFMLPPDFREQIYKRGKNTDLKIPHVRFPRWHYCPRCGNMIKIGTFAQPTRCENDRCKRGFGKSKKGPFLIPVRFIAICDSHINEKDVQINSRYHLEDFPFIEWVHYDKENPVFIENNDSNHKLTYMGGSGASLSGVRIKCSCGKDRSLASCFNEGALKNIKKCGGNRPWLGETDKNNCNHNLKVILSGASNVFFPQIASSIYIPGFNSETDKRIIDILEKNWDLLTRTRVNGKLDKKGFDIISEQNNIDTSKLIKAAEDKLNKKLDEEIYEDLSEEEYRKREYDELIKDSGGENQDLFVQSLKSDKYEKIIEKYFESISLIKKLRETRAFTGFTRLMPYDSRSFRERRKDLYKGNIDWLPAIIVRGEGIFFKFNAENLEKWGATESVKMRTEILNKNYKKSFINEGKNKQEILNVNAKFILIHTFAHLLINQFSYECGYGSSSLRERIYCNTQTDKNMNGVLIYTTSGDSEGSLGGLVRLGKPGNIERIVFNALQNAKWCSSDPLCIESPGQGPESCNLAACHCCCLLPETSCEMANRVLDRGLVVGTLKKSDIGFFVNTMEMSE